MSESLSNPNLLCSPIVTETNVPLVLPDSTVTSHTVNVSACSEFKEYSLPVVHFDATHKLHFALDGDHQPLIFTIGKDKVMSSQIGNRKLFSYTHCSVSIAFDTSQALHGMPRTLHQALPVLVQLHSISFSTITMLRPPLPLRVWVEVWIFTMLNLSTLQTQGLTCQVSRLF